jgi:hypothetical protein
MNRMVRTAFVLAVIACASMLFVTKSSAQSVYGSIFGTVSDSSGAAIPGATITVKDEAKGTVVTTTSNASGDYSVPHLIPDVYDLKVTAKGFKAFATTGISVLADTAPRIDPTLQVGAADTTVTVNADQEPALKTDRADVATVFDQQQVSQLPIGDENFTNLQLLVPGAQLLGWSHAADENPQGSKQIQVDGQAFGGTAFELDGTDNQDPILGIIVINPTLDSVTETKITTQNYDAELGKAVSAVVTAQTRSGTNSFHGDVYDFRAGNANVARDPYSQPALSYTEANGLNPSVPPGLKNRMGGSIGGPIKRDKAFFFFNYEGQRQKVGTSATDTLPTTNLTESALGNSIGGGFDGANTVPGADFGEYEKQFGAAGIIYDTTKPYIGTDGKTHYQPFPDNVIPAADLSPQTLALLTLLEPYTKGITPNSTGAQGNLDQNFHASGTGLFNSNQYTERVDYTLNEKAHMFERFSRFYDTLSGAVMFGVAGGPGFGINNYGGLSNSADDSVAAGMDIAINPKLLTDFRLGYYRYNIIDTNHDQGANFATSLNIPGLNTNDITSGAPAFNVSNVPGGSGGTAGTQYGDGLGVDRCNCPLIEREDQFQIVNNWTKIVGNHTFKAGLDLRYGRNLRVPSDSNRAGVLNFTPGETEDPAAGTPGGLGFASFMLGDVNNFQRYVSTSTNAKEFQKRVFLYGQDTWRVTHNLTLNMGLRWEIYFPETVNGPGQGALLNLSDGYMHVADVGGIGSNLGWSIDKWKQFAPRLGLTYEFDPKTVVRVGYGRSFDTGVFGSIFGHTVTQNIPVLANQSLQSPTNIGNAFTLTTGPMPYVFPVTPPNGLLPNPGTQVSSSARNDPLTFPTIDAWNLSVERALTPTMTLTVAYVGNKGTHTLGDGDSNGTNPNEQAINLPGANSVTGQALHYDNSVPTNTIAADGGANGNLLERYYAATLPACHDPNYVTPNEPYVLPGMCGWNDGIAYRGDDQNTEYDALQITFAKQFTKGLSYNANYQWASAFDEQSGFYTWSHSITHGRDSSVRDQQLNLYGTYELPFGKGRQFASNANRVTDLIIGGYQISEVSTWAGGLPFTLGYNESGSNITTGPGDPSQIHKMSTSLTAFVPSSNGTGNRTFYPAHSLGDGTFVNPGLDNFGNAGINTYRGPRFFSTDMNLIKTFNIWENVATVFRMDVFNVFNHITAGNPGGNIESIGSIGGEGGGCGVGNDCGPRSIGFSLRVQF